MELEEMIEECYSHTSDIYYKALNPDMSEVTNPYLQCGGGHPIETTHECMVRICVWNDAPTYEVTADLDCNPDYAYSGKTEDGDWIELLVEAFYSLPPGQNWQVHSA